MKEGDASGVKEREKGKCFMSLKGAREEISTEELSVKEKFC